MSAVRIDQTERLLRAAALGDAARELVQRNRELVEAEKHLEQVRQRYLEARKRFDELDLQHAAQLDDKAGEP